MKKCKGITDRIKEVWNWVIGKEEIVFVPYDPTVFWKNGEELELNDLMKVIVQESVPVTQVSPSLRWSVLGDTTRAENIFGVFNTKSFNRMVVDLGQIEKLFSRPWVTQREGVLSIGEGNLFLMKAGGKYFTILITLGRNRWLVCAYKYSFSERWYSGRKVFYN